MNDFSGFGLSKQLISALADANLQNPTDIQQKAIPAALAGQDIIGIAQTGTGKTAAYLLPLLMKTKYAQGQHPRALILAPTRELAMQIDTHISILARYTDLRHIALYGGLGPKTQIEQLELGQDIIVATPGRLLDLYQNGHIFLRQIQILVLDEADRMMDMGFMPQLRKLLEVLPTKRQNLLFSATMPPKVETLSEEFLEFPTTIAITPQATPVETVVQALYELSNIKTKIALLEHMILESRDIETKLPIKSMIFAKTKQMAEKIYTHLNRKIPRTSIRVIHADKGQNTRINAMEHFRNGEVRVLVATDVAARGIDIAGVEMVINFDVPQVYEDYVHRIGRTGRARQIGKSFTFCNKAEMWHIDKIEKIINAKIPIQKLPESLIISPTPMAEEQEMLREIDTQKRKDNPEFLGAFHEKKHPYPTQKTKAKSKSKTDSNAKSDTKTKPRTQFSSHKAAIERRKKRSKNG